MAYATTLELGGATRRLRYDLNALAEVEDQLGVTIATLNTMETSAKTIRGPGYSMRTRP